MSEEILKHAVTILISVLAAVATTLLINYIKDQKRKTIERITSYDERIRIINSIALNSFFSFILASAITSANIENNYKLFFIILIVLGVAFFTYAHLRFHKSFLKNAFHNKQTRFRLILILIFILIVWIFILFAISFIESFGDKPTYLAYLFVLLFYTTLFNLSQYYKWEVTRSYNKIIVITVDSIRYESMELIKFDDCIAIYNVSDDKRIIIPHHRINVIEYEKASLADFINEEH